MGPELTITRLQQRAELVQLEEDWERLLGRTDVASPFLTPGWQLAWLDTYGVAHRLFVLTARRGQELVGLWPLIARRRGTFRVLEPIGAGRSDWLDVLAVDENREEVLSAFVRYLVESRSEWDLIEHRDVLSESPTIRVMETLCVSEGVHLRRQPRTVAPYLAIIGRWEQFLDAKRAKFRSNLKYYRRLAERDGRHLDICQRPWTDGAEAMDRLADIERKSWKARAGNLKISTPLGREFYRRFCHYFAGRGQLDLWYAELDASPVAFLINIIYAGKCYHYNTCYEERYAYISPGLLLHAEAIGDAFARELREYDFLSGDEAYKDRWSSHRREIQHLAFYNDRPTSLGAFLVLVWARWTFRRSQILRRGRARLLSATRKLLRRSVAQ